MKITASVDSKLGARTLERGKTYDVKEPEAKYLIRAGLARSANKNSKVEETVKAGKLGAQVDVQPGEEPSTPHSTTRKAGK